MCHQLRHPRRALDLKAKDLIGHLWVSLIIEQPEHLVCYLFLHVSIIFNFNFLHLFHLSALKKFQVFALFGINNWHALCQSKWRNFCMYIINIYKIETSHGEKDQPLKLYVVIIKWLLCTYFRWKELFEVKNGLNT